MKITEDVQYWRDDEVGGLVVRRLVASRHVYPMHSHDEYGVGFMEQGASYCLKPGQENALVHAGQLALFCPGQLHSGIPYAEKVITYRMFYLDPSWLKLAAREVTGKDCLPEFKRIVVQDPSLSKRLSTLHRLVAAQADLLARQTAMLEVCTSMVSGHAELTGPHLSNEEPGAVRKAKDYLRDRLDANVSLQELAEAAGLSRYHLIRVFKRSCGLTPHAYLTQKRVEKATALLKTRTPLSQVALESGFTHQSHFTNSFRRLMGVSPGQFRTAWGVDDE